MQESSAAGQWPQLNSDPGEWQRTIMQSCLLDEAQQIAGYGRCWTSSSRPGNLVLSLVAAEYLGVAPGLHADCGSCLAHVVADDLGRLSRALHDWATVGAALDCQFRLNHPQQGTRWLRLQSLRATSIACAMVTDVTDARHAALREKFNFALTRHLVGSHTLDHALGKILQLVCEDLGWEWGAYWSCDPDGAGESVLSCQHAWHRGDSSGGGEGQEWHWLRRRGLWRRSQASEGEGNCQQQGD